MQIVIKGEVKEQISEEEMNELFDKLCELGVNEINVIYVDNKGV